jgi:nucleoside-diphosphate-sugar epimerase
MIGPSSCTTIKDVAEIIKGHPRINVEKIVYDLSKPTGDIGRFSTSLLAKEELGWTPLVDISDGLSLLIDRIIDDLS